MFYDKQRNSVAYKSDIPELVSDITGIVPTVLENPGKLSRISVACRLSWASKRKMPRVDQVYYLMGIFNINMPLLNGEGPKAFLRLQQEILRHDGDLSLFA